MPIPRPADVRVLDTQQFGAPRAGCAYLIGRTKAALVDAGTAASAPRLLASLRGVRLEYLFITHVHLDHAGAAGHIARAHPETTVIAHPRALPHLADPARLALAVHAASPSLGPLYGRPIPVPAERLRAADDGETFPLGGREIHVTYSPGHAPHHACFFEPSEGILFLGDAAGHCGVPVALPLTVPPRFDRVAARASIDRLVALRPRTLAFAHFGLHAGDARASLAAYPERVDRWLERVAAVRAAVGDQDVTRSLLADLEFRGLSPVDQALVELCVQGALQTLDAEGPR
jgi:glyoxylase-like metal-dependent hydrolase (beta-lactamase superfamily II)